MNTFKRILYKKSNALKIKTSCAIIKAVSAYDPNDYENFSFEGWICLPLNNKFVWFNRVNNKHHPWYYFIHKDFFRKNWKYSEKKKEDFIFGKYYKVKFDFIRKITIIKPL